MIVEFILVFIVGFIAGFGTLIIVLAYWSDKNHPEDDGDYKFPETIDAEFEAHRETFRN